MGRDTIQLEDAVSTISQEYLLEFSSEYFIPENLHPELPGPGDHIVDFPEGKIGVYTKKIEFANFRIPISQFLFDILGYYQIHLSQLSVIGAAKVSHFEINCRVLNIIPTVNLFRVFYVPSYNSGWMSFSKRPGKNTPQCYTKPLDSLKNWNNRFFWVDEKVFPTVVAWRTAATKDDKPKANTYSVVDVATLDTHRTPFQKQPEELLCLVGLSRNFFLRDDEYPIFLNDNDQEMDLFNLIKAPNPTKVKTGTRQRTAHEGAEAGVHGPAAAEQEIPVTDDAGATEAAVEPDLKKEVISMGPTIKKRRRQRDAGEGGSNAPAKVLRKDHDAPRAEHSARGGKLLADMSVDTELAIHVQETQEPSVATQSVSDPDPLSSRERSHGKPRLREIYTFSSYYWVSRKHLPTGMGRKWLWGSREVENLEMEAKLLRKSVAQVTRRDQRIATREKHIKDLKAQLEARCHFATGSLPHVDGRKKKKGRKRIMAAFDDFKQHEDERVNAWCAEMDARLDALSVDFDEELYPHMLTAIVGRRVLMREGLKYGVEHGKARLELIAMEAYDPEADNKYVAALHDLKDLNYPLIDELEQLKDAPLDVIMASLYLDSDTSEDAP
ncbi:hypothetical protein Tco_1268755 [Tanacetum coccineum]